MKRKVSAIIYAKLMACFLDGANKYDIVEETGLHPHTVAEYIAALHKEHVIHIVNWTRENKSTLWIPAYRLGAGKDKPRPRHLTSSEIMKAYRARKQRTLVQNQLQALVRVV